MNAVLLLSLAAHGAEADPFRPSGSLATGQGTPQGESPYLLGEGLSAGVLASFAQDLAVRDFGDRTEPLVRSALPTELYGGWTLADKARFEVFVPLYAYVDAPVTGFAGPASGDLRFQANVPVWVGKDVRLSIVPRIELPTGTTDAFTRRGFQMGLTAALGGRVSRFGWVGNAGISASEASEFSGVGTGSSVDLLGGGWWQATPSFRFGAEAETQLGLVGGTSGNNVVGTGQVFAQNALPSGLALTVGAGTGLIAGVGAPNYRMFAALTYGTTVSDRDGDGIIDREDLCKTLPEDLDGFEDLDGCPDPDNDNDTLVDDRDTCPNQAEDFDDFQDLDGCPDPDNDDDNVLDTADSCPMVPGLPEFDGCPDTDEDGIPDAADDCPMLRGLPELDGCPDRDSDKVPDPRDACPDEPILPTQDPATSDGCPSLAAIVGETITIAEKVQFATGKANISTESHKLLDDVAQLLARHPEIRKVEVGGHTDNVGSEKGNQGLSQRRADAVLGYLTQAGVARNRIVSKGYGELQPLTTNRTPTGRAANRRVEFKILDSDAPPPLPSPTPLAIPVAPQPPPAPQPEVHNPWGATLAPEPVPSVEPDPNGKPGQLTIYLRGVEAAEVYLDNARLPRDAPFERLPVRAGTHRLWVTAPDSGLDFETTIVLGNGLEQILLLPPGGVSAPKQATDEPAPMVDPIDHPQPKPKRPGRRSKKLRK